MLEGIAAACQAGEPHGAAGGRPLVRQSAHRPRPDGRPSGRRPGYRGKAREVLAEAIAMYRQMGTPKHVEMAEAMLGEV